MLFINFYLKSSTKNHDGKPRPINMVLRYSKRKLVFSTGEMILPRHWENDPSKRLYQRAKQSLIGYTELNLLLDKMEQTANTLYLRFKNNNNREPETAELMKLLCAEVRGEQVKDKPNMFEFIQQLIDDAEKGKLNSTSGKKLAKGYIRIFKSTLRRLKQFEQHTKTKVDYESIDLTFYNSWVHFLSQELNLSWNTTGRFVKTIKTVMNAALEAKLTTNTEFKNRKFKVLTETTTKIFLTDEEINQIFELNLDDNSKLDRVRDIFIIQCRTGLRYSDVSNLRTENIEGNFLRIKPIKTGQSILIPIHYQVKEIIEKYKGTQNHFPKAISNVKMNKYLKELAQLIPALHERVQVNITKGGKVVSESKAKWELVCTHVGRRSLCTGLYLEGVSASIIRSISGHTTEQQFMKYLKATPLQNANIILKHWEKKRESQDIQLLGA